MASREQGPVGGRETAPGAGPAPRFRPGWPADPDSAPARPTPAADPPRRAPGRARRPNTARPNRRRRLDGGQQMLVGVTGEGTAVVPGHGERSTHAVVNRAGGVEDSAPTRRAGYWATCAGPAGRRAPTGTRRRVSSPRPTPRAMPPITSERGGSLRGSGWRPRSRRWRSRAGHSGSSSRSRAAPKKAAVACPLGKLLVQRLCAAQRPGALVDGPGAAEHPLDRSVDHGGLDPEPGRGPQQRALPPSVAAEGLNGRQASQMRP